MINNNFTLTYDDIQLVPRFSNVKSRMNVELRSKLTNRYECLIPIIAAPMDTVCELDMAKRLAMTGGVGAIHRFNTIEEQCNIVRELLNYAVDVDLASRWNEMNCNWNGTVYDIPLVAAIGVSEDDKKRAKRLVEAGCNILLIDVAHGHHSNVGDMIEFIKNELPEHIDIIAGNVATAEGAKYLQDKGADSIRAGVGAGAACSTRIKTGFGVPMISCIMDIANVVNIPIIADGGLRSSGDIVKALAVGADTVMLGSMLAGCDEAPGKIIQTSQGLFKRYRGSASIEVKLTYNKDSRNVEGESTNVPYKGGVKYTIYDILDGIRSALSYAGANNLKEFHPRYVQVSNAGMIEAHPHILKK